MKIISSAQMMTYPRALLDTGNATLAAEVAGVSRSWAYKKREQDAWFAGVFQKFTALARERLPVQRRRPRAGGWNPEREQRFIEALAVTDDVPLAARQVGISSVSAYRHRLRSPDFALRWRLAVRIDHAEMGTLWIETIACLLDGEPIPPDNPVQTIGVSDVIRLYQRSCRPRKRRRGGRHR